jgi:hypothetical protein
VDASMVANLIVMIVQGSHQIFIRKFERDKSETPQYLDHIDTGILKVKVALSIGSITLVQILKDFVNLEKVDWVHGEAPYHHSHGSPRFGSDDGGDLARHAPGTGERPWVIEKVRLKSSSSD